jgi:hypothetical protein
MAFDLKQSQKALAESNLVLRAKLIAEGKFTEEDFAHVPAPQPVGEGEVPLDQEDAVHVVKSTEDSTPSELASLTGDTQEGEGEISIEVKDLPKLDSEVLEVVGDLSNPSTEPQSNGGLVEEYEAELIQEELILVPAEVEKSKGKKSKK